MEEKKNNLGHKEYRKFIQKIHMERKKLWKNRGQEIEDTQYLLENDLFEYEKYILNEINESK
jgi:hypothetical protein